MEATLSGRISLREAEATVVWLSLPGTAPIEDMDRVVAPSYRTTIVTFGVLTTITMNLLHLINLTECVIFILPLTN